MEGFLQSLKFEDWDAQNFVCSLVGIKAKEVGQHQDEIWQKDQILWWRAWPFKRKSIECINVVTRAFNALFYQSEHFRAALKATGNEMLTHSIGKELPEHTVMTEAELVFQLMRCRMMLWYPNNRLGKQVRMRC